MHEMRLGPRSHLLGILKPGPGTLKCQHQSRLAALCRRPVCLRKCWWQARLCCSGQGRKLGSRHCTVSWTQAGKGTCHSSTTSRTRGSTTHTRNTCTRCATRSQPWACRHAGRCRPRRREPSKHSVQLVTRSSRTGSPCEVGGICEVPTHHVRAWSVSHERLTTAQIHASGPNCIPGSQQPGRHPRSARDS